MGLVVQCFAQRRKSRRRFESPAGARALLIVSTTLLCRPFAFGIAKQTECTSIAGQNGVDLEMPVDSDARNQVPYMFEISELRMEGEEHTCTHTHTRARARAPVPHHLDSTS